MVNPGPVGLKAQLYVTNDNTSSLHGFLNPASIQEEKGPGQR